MKANEYALAILVVLNDLSEPVSNTDIMKLASLTRAQFQSGKMKLIQHQMVENGYLNRFLFKNLVDQE